LKTKNEPPHFSLNNQKVAFYRRQQNDKK
jgi:hypothetical protein